MKSGPSFVIIPSCKNCEHLTYLYTDNGNHEGCGFLSQPLEISYLTRKYHTINPHKDCPFIANNKKEFLEKESNTVKFEEFNSIEKIIKELFPKLTDYSLYTDSEIIIFRTMVADLDKLVELRNKTNRKITIDTYKTELHITLTKDKK